MAVHWRGRPLGAKSDFSIRIAPVKLELAPGKIVETIGYNGTVPGPVLRMCEGKRVTVDIRNDTNIPELVHWHGQFVPPEVDGAEEEGTPLVPAHGSRGLAFVPRPSGTRWYHTHAEVKKKQRPQITKTRIDLNVRTALIASGLTKTPAFS